MEDKSKYKLQVSDDEGLPISERLRMERVRLGLSQDELAKIGGVSRVTEGKYERGERKPDVAYLTAIYHFAGADVGYIVTGVRANVPLTFDDRVAELSRVTYRVTSLAEQLPDAPDVMRLGPLRDLAYRAQLTDEQVQVILDLLREARLPEFWRTADKQ